MGKEIFVEITRGVFRVVGSQCLVARTGEKKRYSELDDYRLKREEEK